MFQGKSAWCVFKTNLKTHHITYQTHNLSVSDLTPLCDAIAVFVLLLWCSQKGGIIWAVKESRFLILMNKLMRYEKFFVFSIVLHVQCTILITGRARAVRLTPFYIVKMEINLNDRGRDEFILWRWRWIYIVKMDSNLNGTGGDEFILWRWRLI